MPYNISSFKLKELKLFGFEYSLLFECDRKDWLPEEIERLDGNADDEKIVTLEHGGLIIKGILKKELFFPTEFDLVGEGSGTFFDWVMIPCFEKSIGRLHAKIVWESGDSITELIVNNGDVYHEDIEL